MHLWCFTSMRIVRYPPRLELRKHRPTNGRRPIHRPFNNVWVSRVDGGDVGTHIGDIKQLLEARSS